MKKKKIEREEEGIQGERRKGKKKKSSSAFKPVRLVLLVVLSVQREGVVGRIGFTFLPSWATLFTVVQPAISPSPAAPLCWVFCLCPRELVGPAGLCAQVLGRLVGVVLGRQPGHWSADPATLGLSLSGGRGRPGTESRAALGRRFWACGWSS